MRQRKRELNTTRRLGDSNAAPQDGMVEAVMCKEGELVDLGRALVDVRSG